jgi:hypothetical protein
MKTSPLSVAAGLEIPELKKQPTLKQLVQYAGASGDFYELHYAECGGGNRTTIGRTTVRTTPRSSLGEDNR